MSVVGPNIKTDSCFKFGPTTDIKTVCAQSIDSVNVDIAFSVLMQRLSCVFIAFLTALCSSALKQKLLHEVTTMSLLVHPNVMPLIGMCLDEEMPLLIMPFMSNGNVLEYVKQNKVDLHKDQEASEVEVYLLLISVYTLMYLYFWTLH